MFKTLTSPVLIAHRGASAYAPENTLASFLLAAEQGSRAIELDVQLTADLHVVAFHDQNVDRLTNGSGRLSKFTLSQIQSMTLSENTDTYPGESVPTLDIVLASIDPEILLNIELKNLAFPFDKLPSEVSKIVERHNAGDRVYFSSFNPFALLRISQLLPDSLRGRLLYYPATVELHSRFPWLLWKCQTVNISFKSVSRERVESFKQAGRLVFTYTLNRHEDIIKALDLGVDGFFTDDPPLGFKAISDWTKYR